MIVLFFLAPAEFWSQFSRLVQMLRLTWIRNVNSPEVFAESSWLHQNPHKASLSSGCSLLNPPLMQPALGRTGPTHLWTASVRGGKDFFIFPLPASFFPSLPPQHQVRRERSVPAATFSPQWGEGSPVEKSGCTNLRLFSAGIIFVFFCWKINST